MAGLLGFLAAGAVGGLGDGIVAEAKAKREAAIADLANTRLVQREDADRSFRSSEADKGRSFQASEGALDRSYRTEEADKSRSATAEQGRLGRIETVTRDDGTTMLRDGDKFSPATDSEGKPVKMLRTSKTEAPSDVRTAEWLVQQGIAKTPGEAWDKVRSAREGVTSPADVEKMTEAAVKTEFGSSLAPPSPEEVQASRAKNRTRILQNLGLADDPASGKESKPGAAPATVERPKGVTDAQVIAEAAAALKRGAPEDAVRTRLKSMGIDPKEAGL